METATVQSRSGTGVGSATIADLLPAAVQRYGSEPAVMYRDEGGEWTTQSFAQVGERVRGLSLGLMDLGVQKGDKVSILANTRPE
jgi:long-subunit acyl-CoA synthetase (AMP-forming)